MKRVTGIGGIFFRAKNPQASKDWYQQHLGIESNEYGKFAWIVDLDGNKIELWEPTDETTL